jgi:hypothetical protein
MKLRPYLLALFAVVSLQATLNAAAAKTYQVTGPIVALTDTTITVVKNDEKWEIARDPNTKDKADLKVGDQVTIQYRMTATAVSPKPDVNEAEAKKDHAAKPKKD